AAPARAADLSGIVVDQSGAPVPRAFVRIVDRAAPEVSTFSDERGRFTLPAAAASPECQIEAARTGFAPGRAPCDSNGVRVVLHVAPVQEAVVVTATRT